MQILFKHLLTRVLNIAPHEFRRVSISWILKFVLHTATILGFTVILALFVGDMGLENLPYLYIFQAIFAIGGTLALSNILRNFPKPEALGIGGVILFILALSGFFLHGAHPFLFFSVLILAYSVVATQMNIALSLFTEELFSPLESERTFPIIESAEPIGGIFAGLITGFGISLHLVEAVDFLIIWAFFGALFSPLLYFFVQKLDPIPKPHSQQDEFERLGGWGEIKESLKHIFNNPFLKALFFAVVVQWLVFNLIEFQYTTAVKHAFTGGAHGGDSVANQLTHGLGLVHIGIHGVVLFFQLFIASGIIKRFGMVRTIILNPVLVFLSSLTMMLSFSFVTATATKGVFEAFGGLARNAYHSSFYVFRPRVRERAKEFLEGIARPFGMLLGTLIIFLLQYVSHHDEAFLSSFLSLSILFLLGGWLLTSFSLGEKYTLLARKNLETSGHAPEKLDAIEILSQKGHKDPGVHLIKVLNFKNEKPRVRSKILLTLGQIRDTNAIPEIVKCFEDPSPEVKLAAVESLVEFKGLGSHFMGQSFAKHRVIEALQTLFHTTHSKKIKSAVIKVFRNIQHADIVPFLLESLESKDPDTISGAIRVCGLFHDISAGYYLEKFLNHPNPLVRSNTIIALWQFIPYRMKLTVALAGMLESKDDEVLQSGIYAVGETESIQEIPRLIKILAENPENHHLRKHAAIALAKMNHEHSIEHLVELILHPEKDVSLSTKSLFPRVHDNIKKIVNQHINQHITHEILDILEKEQSDILEEMSNQTLKSLLRAYEILGEEKETLQIQEILEDRKKAKEEEKLVREDEKKGTEKTGKRMSLEDLM
ncbi:MAG: HEAT repeat domain-containing protein [Candidatus Peregrinibacteria bacterium]